MVTVGPTSLSAHTHDWLQFFLESLPGLPHHVSDILPTGRQLAGDRTTCARCVRHQLVVPFLIRGDLEPLVGERLASVLANCVGCTALASHVRSTIISRAYDSAVPTDHEPFERSSIDLYGCALSRVPRFLAISVAAPALCRLRAIDTQVSCQSGVLSIASTSSRHLDRGSSATASARSCHMRRSPDRGGCTPTSSNSRCPPRLRARWPTAATFALRGPWQPSGYKATGQRSRRLLRCRRADGLGVLYRTSHRSARLILLLTPRPAAIALWSLNGSVRTASECSQQGVQSLRCPPQHDAADEPSKARIKTAVPKDGRQDDPPVDPGGRIVTTPALAGGDDEARAGKRRQEHDDAEGLRAQHGLHVRGSLDAVDPMSGSIKPVGAEPYGPAVPVHHDPSVLFRYGWWYELPHCTERGFGRSAWLGRAPEDRAELLDVLIDMVDEHSLDDRSDRHLAARRMGAAALDLLGRKLARAAQPQPRSAARSDRTARRRAGPGRDRSPRSAPRRSGPARTGRVPGSPRGSARSDPSSTEPSRPRAPAAPAGTSSTRARPRSSRWRATARAPRLLRA